MPKVSVVMPIYNRAYAIGDAVRSVYDQTYENWELLVMDDGSEDADTLKRKLAAFDDERIHYHRLERTGNISYVRNEGCRRAKGDIIVVHDSDDMAFPNRVEEIVKVFGAHPEVDVVYHGYYLRALDTERNAVARMWKPSQPFDKDRLLKEQYIPGQIAFRKRVWDEVPYDEAFPLIDDWVFLIDLALQNKVFYQLDKELYEYVSLKDSININGELAGDRKKDVINLIEKLKDKYGIEAHAEMTKFTHFGEKISTETI